MITYSFKKKPKFLTKLFKENLKNLFHHIIAEHNKKLKQIHFHFCDDEYLLQINQNHLNHDYYTDIITFDYSQGDTIQIEIFISLDRVEENANFYQVDFINELVRVMIHGVLHCLGYNDQTENEEIFMRRTEDKYISYFYSINVPRGT